MYGVDNVVLANVLSLVLMGGANNGDGERKANEVCDAFFELATARS